MAPRSDSGASGRLLTTLVTLATSLFVGLASAGMLPLQPLAVAGLVGLGALVVVAGRRSPFVVLGAAVVGTAFANSTLAIADPLRLGRFVFPVVLAMVAWQLPVPDRRGFQRAGIFAFAGIAVLVPSTLLSSDPANSALKQVALAIAAVGALGALRVAMRYPGTTHTALRLTFGILVLTNALYVLVFAPGTVAGRSQGWTINPNSLGAIAAFGLVLGLAGLRGRISGRWLVWAGVFASGALLLASGSRNGLLAAMLGVIAVLRAERLARRLLVLLAACAAVLGVFVLMQPPGATGVSTEAVQSFDRSGPSDSGRIDRWGTAWGEVARRPLFGAGYDTTVNRQFSWSDPRNPEGGHFHNSYLEAIVELGVPAALPLIGAGSFALSFLLRRAPVELSWAAGLGVTAAALAMFETGALTAGSTLFLPFWLGVGCLALAPLRARADARHRRAEPVAPRGARLAVVQGEVATNMTRSVD